MVWLNNVAAGTKRIVWGMFKKVVIADRLATYVNIVYNDPARFDSPALVLATYFFAFQIYTDFYCVFGHRRWCRPCVGL